MEGSLVSGAWYTELRCGSLSAAVGGVLIFIFEFKSNPGMPVLSLFVISDDSSPDLPESSEES